MNIVPAFPTPILIHDFADQDLLAIQKEIEYSLPLIRMSSKGQDKPGSANTTFDFSHQSHVNDIQKFNLRTLNDMVMKALSAYVYHIQYNGPELNLDGSWISFLNKGDYYHDHNHPGVKVAAVYYYATNGNDGSIRFTNPNPYMFSGQWPADGTSEECIFFPPKVGRLIMFPAWMVHRVEENHTDNERISISINFK